jgi:hypothetical protein
VSEPPQPYTRAPVDIPSRLQAVLARANDSRTCERRRTAADLVVAFSKETRSTFDAGWDLRGRERLATLARDSQRSPTCVREVLRTDCHGRLPEGRRTPMTNTPASHRSSADGAAARVMRQARVRLAGGQRRCRGAAGRMLIPGAPWPAAVLLLAAGGLSAIVLTGAPSSSPLGTAHPGLRPAGPVIAHSSLAASAGDPTSASNAVIALIVQSRTAVSSARVTTVTVRPVSNRHSYVGTRSAAWSALVQVRPIRYDYRNRQFDLTGTRSDGFCSGAGGWRQGR